MTMKSYTVKIELEVTAESETEALDNALEDAKELHAQDIVYADIKELN